ncbi:MAG: hypothetical protein H6581_31195 [Bacteroidia bacterium]|nr:hypothetical protein [Bacteroidia bacterium]
MAFSKPFTGSAWPPFAKEFHAISGDTVIIVQAARGGSNLVLSGWGSNGFLHSYSCIKARAAINKTGVNLSGVIWLQGEADATNLNQGFINQQDYEQELQWVIQTYRDSFACDLPFYIIQTGLNASQPDSGFLAVRQFQRNVANADWNVNIVYDSTDKFIAKGWMTDGVHYNQTGYNDIGTDIAHVINRLIHRPRVHLDSVGFAAYCPGSVPPISTTLAGAQYHWNTGATTPTLTPQFTGSYWCDVTDINGCGGTYRTDTLFLSILPGPPKPLLVPIGSTNLCQGQKLIMTSNGGYSAYNWSDGNPWQRDTVYTSGDYWLTATGSNGCESPPSDTVTVVFNPLPPQPTVTALGPTSVCEGDTVWLQASPAGYPIYNWNGGNFGTTIPVTQSGTYSVFIVDNNYCHSFPAGGVGVTVSQVPPQPTISYLGQNQLKCMVQGDSYVWLESNVPVAGQNGQILNITSTGVYRVIVFYGACPSDTSLPFSLVGIEDGDFTELTQIFPNPNQGRFSVENNNARGKAWKFSLWDGQGRKVWERSATTWTGKMEFAPGLPAGLYWLETDFNGIPQRNKLLIQD